jgi:Plasmid replication protein.
MPGQNVKKRNWTFLVYPESAPADWVKKLQETGLQAAISPLHDKDIDPDGQPKKAHFHVIVCYSGPTSYNVVLSLTQSLGQPIPKPLEQVRGMYRYFTHMDNPDKFQYNAADISTLNGFNIMDFVDMTRSEVLKIKLDLQAFIRSSNITEYADLMDNLQDGSNMDWYDVASSNTFFFEKYISSRRNKAKAISEKEKNQK